MCLQNSKDQSDEASNTTFIHIWEFFSTFTKALLFLILGEDKYTCIIACAILIKWIHLI